MILNYSILNGALELLPQSLASMAIIPLQMKMVYRIGKSHGYELDRGHIKDFIATLGVGLTSQYVEQFGRKLVGGLLGRSAADCSAPRQRQPPAPPSPSPPPTPWARSPGRITPAAAPSTRSASRTPSPRCSARRRVCSSATRRDRAEGAHDRREPGARRGQAAVAAGVGRPCTISARQPRSRARAAPRPRVAAPARRPSRPSPRPAPCRCWRATRRAARGWSRG